MSTKMATCFTTGLVGKKDHKIYRHSEYGFNKEKIALLGDSAGGNLVAVLCQRLLKEGKQNYLKVWLCLLDRVSRFEMRKR